MSAPVQYFVYEAKQPRTDRSIPLLPAGQAPDYSFQTRQLDTIILLLSSPEPHIVLRCLQHLDQFAELSESQNYADLYKLNILDAIVPLVDHELLFIRRLALKLLSQMFVHVPTIVSQPAALTQVDVSFQLALRTFLSADDNFLVEYSATLLNLLPKLIDSLPDPQPLLSSILKRIATTKDPDLLLLNLTLLVQLATGHDNILCARLDFPFNAILAEVRSEFRRVQAAAMDALSLASHCETGAFLANFRTPAMVAMILENLESTEWQPLHGVSIALLGRVLRQRVVADAFYTGDSLQRLFAFNKLPISEPHRLATLAVLTQLAAFPAARLELHENGLTQLLVDYMKQPDCVVQNVTTGIAHMANVAEAAVVFIAQNTMAWLFEVIQPRNASKQRKKTPTTGGAQKKGTDETVLNDKIEAAKCLVELFGISAIACEQAIGCDAANIIAGCLGKDLRIVPIELKRPLMQIVLAIAKQNGPSREKIMTAALTRVLFRTLFESVTCTIYLVDSLNCAIEYIEKDLLRELMLQPEQNFSQLLVDLLDTPGRPMIAKKTAIDLIRATREYADLTDMFINDRVLECLLHNTESSDECPNWSVAIEIILANNPTVKFALRGYLDFTDRTTDQFYASRTFWKTDYMHLLQIFNSMDCSPFRTIYLSNFQHFQEEAEADNDGDFATTRWKYDRKLHQRLRILREAIEIERLEFPLRSLADLRRCVTLISDVVCSRMCEDNSLEGSLDLEETELQSIESAITFQSVVTETSDGQSIDSSTPSNDPTIYSEHTQLLHTVDLHLKNLKYYHFHDNCIPLGALRVGGYFERSLLFKVLADRIGLPCGLQLSPVCPLIAWNVVAQPTENDDLVATHLVNLMLRPLGCLLAIGTQIAQDYQQPCAAGSSII